MPADGHNIGHIGELFDLLCSLVAIHDGHLAVHEDQTVCALPIFFNVAPNDVEGLLPVDCAVVPVRAEFELDVQEHPHSHRVKRFVIHQQDLTSIYPLLNGRLFWNGNRLLDLVSVP